MPLRFWVSNAGWKSLCFREERLELFPSRKGPKSWQQSHFAIPEFPSRILLASEEKRVYTTTVGPLFSRSVARPRGHRAKKTMVCAIFLGKKGKRVYTIGPERRVYTIEPQTRKKKKRVVSTVVVYTFFFPGPFHTS